MRITMKTKIFYLTAMALCLSGGCKETNSRYDNISTFTPLTETKEIRDLSPYIEDMEMVKVADDDRLLMSDVSKMLLDRSGNMYILDYMGNLVKVDKPDGSYFYAVSVELPDAIYLVKVAVNIDDYEDVEKDLFGSDVDDDAVSDGEAFPDDVVAAGEDEDGDE